MRGFRVFGLRVRIVGCSRRVCRLIARAWLLSFRWPEYLGIGSGDTQPQIASFNCGWDWLTWFSSRMIRENGGAWVLQNRGPQKEILVGKGVLAALAFLVSGFLPRRAKETTAMVQLLDRQKPPDLSQALVHFRSLKRRPQRAQYPLIKEYTLK